MIASTPSEAVRLGRCAVCLGGGETFNIILDRLGPCSACAGVGSLDAMLAMQCEVPDCPDHGWIEQRACTCQPYWPPGDPRHVCTCGAYEHLDPE